MQQKPIHITLAVLFALFALLQYNDPDPFLWMLVYFSVSIVAILKLYLRQINFKPLLMTLIIILGLFSLTYLPGVFDFLQKPDKEELFGSMAYKKPWIEETREFLGLLIAIGALLYLRKDAPKKRRKKR